MSDHEICKEFLEKLLDIEIEKIEMPSSQKVIDLLLDCKGIRLDIYVKDDTQKIILNTKGLIDDIDDELLDFLRYVENSNEKTAESTKGTLVKHIHEKVIEVKKDKNVEVEFMTLLERDREKIEEGMQKGIGKGIQKGMQEATKKTAINLLKMGMTEEIISQATGLSIEQIKEIARNL